MSLIEYVSFLVVGTISSIFGVKDLCNFGMDDPRCVPKEVGVTLGVYLWRIAICLSIVFVACEW